MPANLNSRTQYILCDADDLTKLLIDQAFIEHTKWRALFRKASIQNEAVDKKNPTSD